MEETNKRSRPYKVRITWDDTKTQLASYADLYKAVTKAMENPGYNVYLDGECVFSSVEDLNSTTDSSEDMPVVEHDVAETTECVPEAEQVAESWIHKFIRTMFRRS